MSPGVSLSFSCPIPFKLLRRQEKLQCYNVVSPAPSVTHDLAFSLSQLPLSHHMGLKLGIHVTMIIATNDCYLSHVKLQLV